jgi:hypothetical protein
VGVIGQLCPSAYLLTGKELVVPLGGRLGVTQSRLEPGAEGINWFWLRIDPPVGHFTVLSYLGLLLLHKLGLFLTLVITKG